MEQSDVVYNLMRMIERVYRCRVCIVDGAGNFLFSQNFPEIDTVHLSPNCHAYKRNNNLFCQRFANVTVREFGMNKKIFCKICPAGFMEIVITVNIPGYKTFNVFAGIFKPFEEKDLPPESLIFKKKNKLPLQEPLTELTTEEFNELFSLMALLGQALTDLFQQQLYESKQYPLVPQVMIRDFINGKFRADISLNDLAKHLGWTPSHTTVRVREYFGKTFTELLNRRRIENAKWLLSNEFPASMAKIAIVSGFRTPSYFFRMFRKYVGMTPIEYRAILEKENKVGQLAPPEDF